MEEAVSYCIANVSFGKDSLAMLHGLIGRGWPLDEVVFYDTGMEFEAIYAERDRILPLLREKGVRYTELRPRNPMWWDMFCRPVKSRDTGEVHKRGYGWCGGPCRWGTREKARALERLAADRGGALTYVGIAADETPRIERERNPMHRLPLVEWGMTESDCLAECYERGATWEQDGVRLYDVLDRVSCWCCKNKNMAELRAIREQMPETWARLVALENAIGTPMKSRPLREI